MWTPANRRLRGTYVKQGDAVHIWNSNALRRKRGWGPIGRCVGRDGVFILVKMGRSLCSAHETWVKPSLKKGETTEEEDWSPPPGWEGLPDLEPEEVLRVPQMVWASLTWELHRWRRREQPLSAMIHRRNPQEEDQMMTTMTNRRLPHIKIFFKMNKFSLPRSLR